MKILLIEDDADISEFLKKKLREKCCVVDSAKDGDIGSRRIRTHHYDMILIDYGLPGKDGLALIQELRGLSDPAKSTTPVIMISVTHELMTKITALDYGADDYIAKPFLFGELFARIQAVLRRPRVQTSSITNLGDLCIDSNSQQVTKNGIPIRLTRKEFSLLEYLVKNQGAVLSRSEIIEHVWDMNSNPFTNAVDVHITSLRKKLSLTPEHTFIHNIPGRGYIVTGDSQGEFL